MNRSEALDFMSLIEGSTENEDTLKDETLSSYEMRLTGSSNPNVEILNPYISRISFSNINSFVTLRTREDSTHPTSVSPDRVFFYPDKFTLFSANASISGTPFSTNSSVSAKSSQKTENETNTEEDFLRSFGIPRSPWDEIPANENTNSAPSVDDLVPPSLQQTFTIPAFENWPIFTIGYNLNPSGAVELQYNSSANNWLEAEDVKWDDVSSVLSLIRLNGEIDFTAKAPSDFYTVTFGLSSESSWRDYSYINDKAEEFDSDAKINNARETNYTSSFITGSSELISTIRPFPQHDVWKNSNVTYTLKNFLAKTEFSGTADNPDWKIIHPSWDKDGIEIHKLTTNVAANIFDKNQSFVFDAELPPREGSFTTTADLKFWFSETYVNGTIREPFKDDPIFDPYTFSETIRLNDDDYLRYSMIYHPDEDQITSITAGLGFKGFTASFSSEFMTPYEFNNDSTNLGWILSNDEKELVPKDFSLGYKRSFNVENFWKNRISFSVNIASDIAFDLQRYTYSRFNFDLGVTFKIRDLLDISFSTQSANSVVYRYIQDIPFFELPVQIPGEKNAFIDLFNSFRFDDESLRKSSGFKLQQLSLDLTHYMGDWNMNLNISLAPYLDMKTIPFSYKFNTEVSFMVTWVPISLIKSEIKYDKDIFSIR
jgi:hypothetical protein